MKDAFKRAEAYDLKGFLEEVDSLDEIEFDAVISRFFTLPNTHLYPHDLKKRRQRNDFFSGLMKYSADNAFTDSFYILENKADIASCADTVTDQIKHSLKEADISKEPIDTQFWSHIRSTERDIDAIQSESEAFFAKQFKAEGGVTVGSSNVINSSGHKYDTDYAIEQKINALSLTLSMLGFENKQIVDNLLIIGDLKEPNTGAVMKASVVQDLAVAWDKLEDTASRVMMFAGDATEKKDKEVQLDARNAGIKRSYHFEPRFSSFEAMDFISSHRVIEANTQAFFGVILENNLKNSIVQKLSDINSLDDGRYISEGEICALLAFSQQYGTDIFSDTKTCEGLIIREWVRAYSCLIYLARGSEESTKDHCYSKTQLINLLIAGGLNETKANSFISNVTFGSKSRDLYDCPLLKLDNDKYYLFFKSIQNSNVYFILSSQFSSLDFVYDKKGINFEKQVNEKLIRSNILAKSFKFKRGIDEYEYDSVFIMDEKVFVVECKNRSLPCWNPVRGARFKKFIDDTTLQVKRLVNGLMKHPEVFNGHFDKNISDFEIIPIILSSLPFAYMGVYDDVFISDASSFGRFFDSREITFNEYQGKNSGQVKKKNIHRQWATLNPTSNDFLEHLDSLIQLRVYLNSLQLNHAWFKISEEVAFTVSTLNIDYRKGLEMEFGDSIKPFKAKPELLSNKKPKEQKKKKKALMKKTKNKSQKKARSRNRRR